MFNHHSVEQNITSIQACNPNHLVKIQDREGKPFLFKPRLSGSSTPLR